MKSIVNRRRNKQVNSFFRNPRSTPYKEPSSSASETRNAPAVNCVNTQVNGKHITKEG